MPATREIPPADPSAPAVILQGGPAALCEVPYPLGLDVVAEELKIEYLGGYEHFARVTPTAGADPADPVVFCWTSRTRIAE